MTISVELHIDEERRKPFAEATGIYVRAKDGGAWINADIAQLDKASLFVWLRSRGGDNPWAEAVVAMLLGHEGDEADRQKVKFNPIRFRKDGRPFMRLQK